MSKKLRELEFPYPFDEEKWDKKRQQAFAKIQAINSTLKLILRNVPRKDWYMLVKGAVYMLKNMPPNFFWGDQGKAAAALAARVEADQLLGLVHKDTRWAADDLSTAITDEKVHVCGGHECCGGCHEKDPVLSELTREFDARVAAEKTGQAPERQRAMFDPGFAAK